MLSVLIIVAAWRYVQAPWSDTAADLREMQDNMVTGAGYEGTDEYTPNGADPSSIDKSARKVTVAGPAHAAIDVLHWDAESKIFTVQMSAPIPSLARRGERDTSAYDYARRYWSGAGAGLGRHEPCRHALRANMGPRGGRMDLFHHSSRRSLITCLEEALHLATARRLLCDEF
jgi:hypothetical protein